MADAGGHADGPPPVAVAGPLTHEAAPVDEGLAAALRRVHVSEMLACLYDPFCIELAAGTLPQAAFATFVVQDVAFLHTFSAAYGRLVHLLDAQATAASAAGASSSKRVAQLRNLAARVLGLIGGVAEELAMHAKTPPPQQEPADINQPPLLDGTTQYTSFLADVCATGTAAEIAAATAPCMRLYAFIGQHLVAALGGHVPDSHPYHEWLTVYGGDAFEKLAVDQEVVLDGLARLAHVGGDAGAGDAATRLATLYSAALRLERGFFRGVPGTRGTPSCPLAARPRLGCIGVDFDGTLTYEDTTYAILEAAGADVAALTTIFKARRGPAYAEDANGSLDAFLARTNAFEAELHAPLRDALRSADAKSIAAHLAATTRLRDNALRVLRLCALDAVRARVFTLNVSRTCVEACMTRCGELELAADLGVDRIVGEELCGGVAGDPPMTNGADKRRAFASFAEEAPGIDPGTISAYIGDSTTDIEPLLTADVGILLLRDDSNDTAEGRSAAEEAHETVRLLRAHGVAVRPLAALALRWAGGGCADASVVYVSHHGWREVEAALFPNRVAFGALEAAPAPRCLSAAGSDSGGGAGIQADLKAFAAHGAFGMTAVTALTAQNTRGVQDVHVVPLAHFEAQVRSVLNDLGVDAIKTGMVPTKEHMKKVVEGMNDHAKAGVVHAPAAGGAVAAGAGTGGAPFLVIDPVMVAAAGDTLVDARNVRLSARVVFPFATVVTPNLPEAKALLGGDVELAKVADLYEAAGRIRREYGPAWVLVKGGHLPGGGDGAVDVLCGAAASGGDVYYELRAPFVPTRNAHGTGCTLGSSIAAQLALGRGVPEAVFVAKQYLTATLWRSRSLQLGAGANGPLNHLAECAVFGGGAPRWPVGGTLARPRGPSSADGVLRLPPGALALYAITDAGMFAKHGRTVRDAVRDAIRGGATIVQVREKDVTTAQYVAAAREAVCARDELRLPRSVPVLVNDRVDVCLAAGADGVHLGLDDLGVADARAVLGPRAIIGATAKTPATARSAQAAGADYLGCGAAFASATKPTSSIVGAAGIRKVCAAVSIPVVGIGGITRDNARGLLDACPSLAGVAVVGALFDVGGAEEGADAAVEHAARRLRDALAL